MRNSWRWTWTILAVALLALGAACSKSGAGSKAVTLQKLEVDPAGVQLAKGTELRLAVTGIFSDNTTHDLSAQAAWSTSDDKILHVERGVVRAVGVGQAQVRVQASGLDAAATIEVTAARIVSLAITPPASSMAKGLSGRLFATAVFTDATTQEVTEQAAWTSSDPSVAEVLGGQVTMVGVGSATIGASVGGLSASAAVEATPAQVVGIDVAPPGGSLPKGLAVALAAKGLLTDGTHPDITSTVVWSVSDPDVAAISGGTLTARDVGTVDVTAALPLGQCAPAFGCSSTVRFTITPAQVVSIAVTPTPLTLPAGLQRPFAAVGTYTDGSHHDVTATAVWSTSDETLAAVSNAAGAQGLVRALAPGQVKVLADMDGWVQGAPGKVTGSADLAVSDAALLSIEVKADAAICREPCGSLALGLTRQFQAWGLFSDGAKLDLTAAVTWTSQDAAVATVSNAAVDKGLATSVHVGETLITATEPRTLKVGGAALLVSEKLLVSVTIAPAAAQRPMGMDQAFNATGRFTDNTTGDVTKALHWLSSDRKVATIGEPGFAHALAVGQADIVAMAPEPCGWCVVTGIADTARLTVTPAVITRIDVSASASSIPRWFPLPFRALATFSDGTTGEITTTATWASANAPVATVLTGANADNGIVTGWTPGRTTVSARQGGVTGQATLDVTSAQLLDVACSSNCSLELQMMELCIPTIGVDPPQASIAKGDAASFRAWGRYSDHVTREITSWVSWSEADWPGATGVASVSNARGTEGEATGLAVGTATITATDPFTGKAGWGLLEVTPKVARSLALSPDPKSVPAGVPVQFQALVTYSDGSSADQTVATSFVTDASAVAYFGHPGYSAGQVFTKAPGHTTVTATFANGGIPVSDTASLVVTDAQLLSLDVRPKGATIPLGTTLQMEAMGTYTDGVHEVTGLVSWDSSGKGVGLLSNLVPSKGLFSSIATGETTVTAILEDPYSKSLVNASTTVAVGPPALVAMSLEPACGAVALGATRQFKATGYYTDGSSADVTQTVQWKALAALPSAPSAAVGMGEHGLATGLEVGSALVEAIDPASGVFAYTWLGVDCACAKPVLDAYGACTGCAVVAVR